MGLDLPHTKRKRVEMRTTTRDVASYIRFALAPSILLAFTVTTFGAEMYREEFSGDQSLADRGFTGIAHWSAASDVSVTSSPGGWGELSTMTTPSFDPAAYEEDRSVSASFRVRYPTEYDKSWRENNKLYVYYLDEPGGSGYRICFKPNQEADRNTSPDLYLYKVTNGSHTKIDSAWTHLLAPHGPNSNFVTLSVTLSYPGEITVSYDRSGQMVEYLTHSDASYSEIGSISWEYKTGTGDNENYYIEIDDIVVEKQDATVITNEYREDFSGTESLEGRGFSDISYWLHDEAEELTRTSSPGGWGELSTLQSPSFGPIAYEEDRRVGASFKVRYPTEYDKSWRENNKLYVYYLDEPGGSGYRICFKPNQEADRNTSPDLYLYKVTNGSHTKIDSAWTHLLAPHGPNSNFVTLSVTLSYPGEITVSYDGSGQMVEYLTHSDASYSEIGSISWEYKTGTGDNENYYIELDDILVKKQEPPETVTISPGDDVDISAVLRQHRDNFQDRLNVQFLEGTYKYGVTVAAPGMTYKLR